MLTYFNVFIILWIQVHRHLVYRLCAMLLICCEVCRYYNRLCYVTNVLWPLQTLSFDCCGVYRHTIHRLRKVYSTQFQKLKSSSCCRKDCQYSLLGRSVSLLIKGLSHFSVFSGQCLPNCPSGCTGVMGVALFRLHSPVSTLPRTVKHSHTPDSHVQPFSSV